MCSVIKVSMFVFQDGVLVFYILFWTEEILPNWCFSRECCVYFVGLFFFLKNKSKIKWIMLDDVVLGEEKIWIKPLLWSFKMTKTNGTLVMFLHSR